jgi:hypothetical protein
MATDANKKSTGKANMTNVCSTWEQLGLIDGNCRHEHQRESKEEIKEETKVPLSCLISPLLFT